MGIPTDSMIARLTDDNDNADAAQKLMDMGYSQLELAGALISQWERKVILEKDYKGLEFDYAHLLSFVVAKGLGSEFDKFPVLGA